MNRDRIGRHAYNESNIVPHIIECVSVNISVETNSYSLSLLMQT